MNKDASLTLSGLNVSRETERALVELEALVRKWTLSINLVSKSSIADIRNRHTVDSAQLFEIPPIDSTNWLDLGSGGGFPGLVIAILAKERRPTMAVTVVESDLRKATFLREASRVLGLKVEIRNQRIETLTPQKADVVSARALAPLNILLDYASRHLSPNGVAIFPKGERFEAETEEARARWNFQVDSLPSLSDSRAAILIVRNIQRADRH
jgi:16S rRNA (guanine527-N7)-methyltransferase